MYNYIILWRKQILKKFEPTTVSVPSWSTLEKIYNLSITENKSAIDFPFQIPSDPPQTLTPSDPLDPPPSHFPWILLESPNGFRNVLSSLLWCCGTNQQWACRFFRSDLDFESPNWTKWGERCKQHRWRLDGTFNLTPLRPSWTAPLGSLYYIGT